MEEKERFEFIDFEDRIELIDTKNKKALDNADKIKDTLNEQDKQIADLEVKLAESEEKVKHWHDLYNERDKQFQSVRQRYHLLNKLQSNYDKKDKLHLAYMQCLELVEENEKLKQSQKQLAISELEKIYNLFEPYENSQKDTILCANNGISFIDYLENQIKSLKGEE